MLKRAPASALGCLTGRTEGGNIQIREVFLESLGSGESLIEVCARHTQVQQVFCIGPLIHAGARLHQAGCNGCIGMGQAPATDTISLRTVPRNFPGRSGTREDKVCLVSPETAAASALKGVISDPGTLGIAYPRVSEPDNIIILSLIHI